MFWYILVCNGVGFRNGAQILTSEDLSILEVRVRRTQKILKIESPWILANQSLHLFKRYGSYQGY